MLLECDTNKMFHPRQHRLAIYIGSWLCRFTVRNGKTKNPVIQRKHIAPKSNSVSFANVLKVMMYRGWISRVRTKTYYSYTIHWATIEQDAYSRPFFQWDSL